ncbi:MAG: hypothetical protein WCT85_01445, partial [Parachlamydiales bacterium]
METLKNDEDFRCFIDGDACFTTNFWGKQLEDIINKYKECGCFVGITNRIGCEWQRTNGVDWNNNDIEYHRSIGLELQKVNYDKITDVSVVPQGEVLGGVLMLLQKKVWKKI